MTECYRDSHLRDSSPNTLSQSRKVVLLNELVPKPGWKGKERIRELVEEAVKKTKNVRSVFLLEDRAEEPGS